MKKIFLVTFLLVMFVFVGFSQSCPLSSEKSIDPVITIGDVSLDTSVVSQRLVTLDGGSLFNSMCDIKPQEGDKPVHGSNYNVSILSELFKVCSGNCLCPLCLNNKCGKPEEDNERANFNGCTGINFNDETENRPNKRGYDLVLKYPIYGLGSTFNFDNFNYYRTTQITMGNQSISKRGYDLVLKYPIYGLPVLETLTDKVIV